MATSVLPLDARMRQIVGTSAQWAANDLVIGDGEIAIERLVDGSVLLRAGNGTLRFSQLAPIGANITTFVYGDGTTDNSAALAAANALGKRITFVGVSVINTPTTITSPIVDTLAQIFSPGSQVTIANSQAVRPEWWGIANTGTVQLAVAALPAGGGTVQLEVATYKPNGHVYGAGAAAGVAMTKNNVRILGRKMPAVAGDCRSLQAGSGSIIQGPFIVYADNVELSDFGVDDGITVVQAYNAGTAVAGSWGEGLICSYPSDTLKNAAALRVGLKLRNLIGLCPSPTAPTHAMIAGEGYVTVRATGELVGIFGVHGCAIKCRDFRAGQISTYANGTDGVVIKSDAQASAVAGNIRIDSLTASRSGPESTAPYVGAPTANTIGLLFQAAGNSVDGVQIDKVNVLGYPMGISTVFGGAYAISSVQLGQVLTDCTGATVNSTGVSASGAAGQKILRFNIASLQARNCTYGLSAAFVQSGTLNQHVQVGTLDVVNAVVALNVEASSYVGVATVITDTCSDAVYRLAGTPKLSVGQLFKDTATPATYSAIGGGLVPALKNAWTQVAGNEPFGVDLQGGRIGLRGLVKPGTNNIFCTLPQWAWPGVTKRGLAQGYNGTTQVALALAIGSNGDVLVNEAGGGTANCTSWLALTGFTYDQQS